MTRTRALPLPALAVLAALALPAPAAYARESQAPRVTSVTCWPEASCPAGPRHVAPGTRLRVAGRGLGPGARVHFLGRARDRRDDRTATAAAAGRGAIVVRVPRGARSGRLVVRTRAGRLSRPSAPIVVAPARDLAGSADPVSRTVVTAAAAAALAAGATAGVVLADPFSDPAPAVSVPAPSAPAPPTTPLPSAPPAAPAPAPDVPRLFAPDSVWNRTLGDDEAVDPTSPALVAGLVAEVRREQAAGNGPYINTTQYSTPIYRVPADQPPVYVHLDNPNTHPSRSALQAAFAAVPIPEGAVAARGTDGHMTIWQPETDRLWELWRARKEADGWHATWGGAIENVSSHPGYYGPSAWPGATSGWGASATSLPVAAGLMKLDELKAGRIDHAVALGIPAPRAGVYAWPAQRTDGYSTAPDSLPEGARLRLDPKLDLSKLALPKMTRMIAEAAQRHGILITDKAGVIAFAAEDPTPTGSNPYWASGGHFEGRYPHDLLSSFPWESLQVMKMDLRGG